MARDIWDQLEPDLPHGDLQDEMFEVISAYADDECGPKERRLAEAYLSENQQAAATLGLLRKQSTLISSLSEEPPFSLRDRILSQTTGKQKAFRLWPATAALSATAAAAATVFWLSILPGTPERIAKVPEPSVTVERTEPEKFVAVVPKVEQDAADRPKQTSSTAKFVPVTRPRTPEKEDQVANTPEQESIRANDVPGNHVSVAYMVVDTGSQRQDVSAPDTVALVGQAVGDTPPAATDTNKEEVGTDARQKLRDRLKKLNQENQDIKEAVGTTTS